MTRKTKPDLASPFNELECEFHSRRKMSKSKTKVENTSSQPDIFTEPNTENLLYKLFEEEVTPESIKNYMNRVRNEKPGIVRPTFGETIEFELRSQILKEIRENTFSGEDFEDANEQFEKNLEIIDLFHEPDITEDQILLKIFPMTFTSKAHRWT